MSEKSAIKEKPLHFQYMETYAPSRAATKKAGKLPKNFAWYDFGLVGGLPGQVGRGMRIIGCQFREAKSGPNKGELVVQVKGTSKTVVLTRDEIAAEGESL